MERAERQAWGPLIRQTRERLGLSQQELAEQAQTSRRTVGSIERGDTAGQPAKLEMILKVLGLEPKQDLPADIKTFLAMLESLLPKIEEAERQVLFPQVIALIAASLEVTHDVVVIDSDSDATQGRL